MSDRVSRIFERDPANSVVVPGSRVIRSAEVAHVGGRPEISTHVPSIELVTEANIVRAIDVTCACGEKMRLWCSYESDAEPPNENEAA